MSSSPASLKLLFLIHTTMKPFLFLIHTTMKPISSFLQTFNTSFPFFFTLLLGGILLFSFGIRRRRSRLPPGPLGVPLLGNLPFLDPELHIYFTKLAHKYGPIVKLQLGRKIGIIVNSSAAAREVLKDQDITFANRDVPQAGRVATYGGADIVWAAYGPEWRMMRKVSTVKMLSNVRLDSVYELRRRAVRNTVAHLYRRAGSAVNVGEQGFLTIYNIVTSMLWGGSVDGDEREKIGTEFRELVSDITELLGKPNISDFFPSLARFDLQGIEKQMLKHVAKLDNIFEKMIDERLRIVDAKRNDFLQFLLDDVRDEGDFKTPLTMAQLKALLMDMVIGGTDTTSNTMEFAMAELIKNPKIAMKIHQELATVVGEQNIVEESHIHSLPYLKAVVKETLRLHPVLPLLVPHSPSETTTVSNYAIPKGCRVFVNVWAIQRDPNVWENPLVFDPERFMNGQCDFNGSDFRYIPFGSGRRNCAGIGLAERMVMYLLATFLHSFDWELKEGEKLETDEKFGIVLKMKTPLVTVFTPRLSDPTLYQ